MATGRLVSLDAAEGQRVAAGQALARLDDREARARVAELEARQTFLNEQIARQIRLRETGVSSQAAFDQARSELDQNRAALAEAQKRLSDLTLRSPLNGTVLQRDGEIGETVKDTATLFWVGDASSLWAVADVDEDDIAQVRPGLVALIKADAFPGAVERANVAEITPKGDSATRSFRVRLSLPADTRFRVGMTVEANIVLRETVDAVLVPVGAVQGGRVWRLVDGFARAQAVETGVVGPRLIEVRSGVAAGDEILADPPAALREGQRLRRR
jgi:RND family efflux transporter MFP subunit